MQVVTNISQLTKDQQENALWNTLDVKEAAILHKYTNAIAM